MPDKPFPVDIPDPGADAGLPTLDHLDDDVVEAVGLASEAMEYVERARGHLYEFHQLTGHADLTFGRAAQALADAGCSAAGQRLDTEVVGRNVLHGRWTFQVVDEFEDSYYSVVQRAVRAIEDELTDGRRHVHEARMKARRITDGRPGHEATPAQRNET